MPKQFSIIAAIAENYAIGKDNKLLWHISEDLKRFKELTSGKTIIMGKNTYLSLPVRPLKNRTNLVISDNPADQFEGCLMAYSLEEAIEKADSEKENFVIGGAMVYKQFFTIAQRLYITHVLNIFDADTFFPKILIDEWGRELEGKIHRDEKSGLRFQYVNYTRK
jgi:dihydrofolate reductase